MEWFDVALFNSPVTIEYIAKQYLGIDSLDSLDSHTISSSDLKNALVKALDSSSSHQLVYERRIMIESKTIAALAEIYDHLFCPEKLKISKASQLIKPLTLGLFKIKSDPDYYGAFYGYEDFLSFLEEYLNACIKYPDATIH